MAMAAAMALETVSVATDGKLNLPSLNCGIKRES
jgi:hypothetical protein